MVQDREDAAEICQTAFLKAYANLATFDTGRRFFSWIYRIAMNDTINFLSSRRPAEPLPMELPSRMPGPEDLVEAHELRREMSNAIAGLSPGLRAVFVARHFTHLSYAEIAIALDIPEKTVKSRLFDARRILRDRLVAVGYGRRLSNA
jgi:RNA polymerase sigma-70 factor (ECF subfamily)